MTSARRMVAAIATHQAAFPLASQRSLLQALTVYRGARALRTGEDEIMDDPAVRRNDAHEGISTVLVVEDEPVIRELMAILLEEEGYVVRQAVDGLAALEVIEQQCVDLVLSDVKMPRLDGASLVQRLRARGDPIPVVLMSAVYAEVDLPGVQFLRKPVNCEHLLTIIAAALAANGRSAPGGALADWSDSAPFIG